MDRQGGDERPVQPGGPSGQAPPPTTPPSRPAPGTEATRAQQDQLRGLQRARQARVVKVVVALVILVVLIIFVIANSDPVKVNFVVVTRHPRLIWVMIFCAVLGGILGYLIGRPGRLAARGRPKEEKRRP